MPSIKKPNHKIPGFIIRSCGNLQQHGVTPEALSFYKIHAMFRAIGFAFGGIELKGNHGIKNIP